MTLFPVSLPVPESPAPSAASTGDAAGQRMRAIDTLLADRGELFQALFIGAPIAKAMVELDGRVLVANPMMCALTGRTSEELAGRPGGRRGPRAGRRARRRAVR